MDENRLGYQADHDRMHIVTAKYEALTYTGDHRGYTFNRYVEQAKALYLEWNGIVQMNPGEFHHLTGTEDVNHLRNHKRCHCDKICIWIHHIQQDPIVRTDPDKWLPKVQSFVNADKEATARNSRNMSEVSARCGGRGGGGGGRYDRHTYRG